MMRTVLIALAAGTLAAMVSGCTVRPLYSDIPLAGSGQTTATTLASIAVRPVNTRVAQEVRNQLIFLFSGGAGQPTAPEYQLGLSVSARREITVRTQTTAENEPTAGLVTVTASYNLISTATGETVTRGRRSIAAAFDIPRQEYAAYRAELDAQNRAAREVAHVVSLAVAADLARLNGG